MQIVGQNCIQSSGISGDHGGDAFVIRRAQWRELRILGRPEQDVCNGIA